jgi:hypothetical protein
MGYSPGGKAHRILHRLVQGPATRRDIARLIQGPNQCMAGASARARSFSIQLRHDGLIYRVDEVLTITEAGRRAYDRLGALEEVVPPKTSVRIFERRAA